MKRLVIILTVVVATATLFSCSSRKVTRVNPDETIDLSGRWNSTDAQQTAEAMISQALSERWISDFQNKNDNQKPVVIVGFVENKTHEHIDAEVFIHDLEKAFINSGLVKLVQGGEKREQIRGEKADQQDYSSTKTITAWGEEIGADFMLQGDMSSIVDTYKKEKVLFYKVSLQLTNIETNEVVWIGDKEIKKYVNK